VRAPATTFATGSNSDALLALDLPGDDPAGLRIIPTAIANAWFMPKHLIPEKETAIRPMAMVEDAATE